MRSMNTGLIEIRMSVLEVEADDGDLERRPLLGWEPAGATARVRVFLSLSCFILGEELRKINFENERDWDEMKALHDGLNVSRRSRHPSWSWRSSFQWTVEDCWVGSVDLHVMWRYAPWISFTPQPSSKFYVESRVKGFCIRRICTLHISTHRMFLSEQRYRYIKNIKHDNFLSTSVINRILRLLRRVQAKSKQKQLAEKKKKTELRKW